MDEIDFPSDVVIRKIATGKHHVLALDSNGKVWTWGKNNKGQLGYKIDKEDECCLPYKLHSLDSIFNIFAGEYMSFSVGLYG